MTSKRFRSLLEPVCMGKGTFSSVHPVDYFLEKPLALTIERAGLIRNVQSL